VQIYRGFDLGSGKPTRDERARAPHHLIDAIEPSSAIDAARFAEMASRAMATIKAAGKTPILCGGTFLWAKALLFGLAEAPAGDAEIRARHRAVVEAEGNVALHARLVAVDPALADRLHPNDLVRVSRALEVYELTGRPLSAWQDEHAFKTPRFHARLVAIAREPDVITARIEARVRAWLAAGWIDETRALIAAGHGAARAMGSVGYREIHGHLRGEIAEGDLPRAIVRSTRIFARRQRTFLNHAKVDWLA
jgi:tRNA dimethylallyltransferase